MSRTGLATVPRTALGRNGLHVRFWLRRRRALRSARRVADAELLTSEYTSPATAWRAAELTTRKNRLELAHSVRRVLRAADARLLPGATPLNRVAVREQTAALLAVAHRLSDLDRPVAARGILLLDLLITDGDGPLYVSYRGVELGNALAGAAEALEMSS